MAARRPAARATYAYQVVEHFGDGKPVVWAHYRDRRAADVEARSLRAAWVRAMRRGQPRGARLPKAGGRNGGRFAVRRVRWT